MEPGATAFIDFRDHAGTQTLHIFNKLTKLTMQTGTCLRELTGNVVAHAAIVVAGIGAATSTA